VLSQTISGRGQLQKSLRKSNQWDLFLEFSHAPSIRRMQLQITFIVKKEWPEKAQNIPYNTDSYHLNQA
jgi:hypothetical protein